MKTLFMISLFFLVGCNEHTKRFGQGLIDLPGNMVKSILRIDEKDKKEEANQNNRIADLEKRLALIEEHNNLVDDILDNIDIQNDEQDLELGVLAGLISDLNVSHTSSVVFLQGQIDTLKLLTQNGVARLIDPCGDSSDYDEVLIKLNSGEIVGYFEQGAKRFLSVLKDGTYITTDNSSCLFIIQNGELL